MVPDSPWDWHPWVFPIREELVKVETTYLACITLQVSTSLLHHFVPINGISGDTVT
jgi:hypothetical protein